MDASLDGCFAFTLPPSKLSIVLLRIAERSFNQLKHDKQWEDNTPGVSLRFWTDLKYQIYYFIWTFKPVQMYTFTKVRIKVFLLEMI